MNRRFRRRKVLSGAILGSIAMLAVGLLLAFDARPDPSTDTAPGPSAPPSVPAAPPTAGVAGGDRFFAADSFWNTLLEDDAPLDARSRVIVDSLLADVAEFGPWMNTAEFSTPIYVVGAEQPRVRVEVDNASAAIREQVTSVPIPDHAEPAPGRDAHLTVWQPSTNTLWELWRADRRGDQWRSESAGRVDNVSRSDGILPSPIGATATGLPLVGGTITFRDLEAGRIDHVLALAVVRPRADWWSWPAQRTDGWAEDQNAVPEGARFRLDPSLDLDTLDLPAPTRMLAEAAQRYGMVVRDRAGSVNFYGEQATNREQEQAWIDWRQGLSTVELTEAFPWEHLQLLEMDLSTWDQ